MYHLGLYAFFLGGIPPVQSDWNLSFDHGLDYASKCENNNNILSKMIKWHVPTSNLEETQLGHQQTASATLKHSPEEAARFPKDVLRDGPRQTCCRVIKSARSSANISLCYEHVSGSKQFPKSEGSSDVL